MRNLLALYLVIPLALAAADKKPPAQPKAGIKTPGVQIPIVSLKSEAAIDAAPPWIGVADQLLVPESEHGTLLRLDPKTNKLDKPIAGISKPCGGTVVAFGSIWTASCADHALLRIDPKKWEVTGKVASGVSSAALALAASPDSVWVFSDDRTTLSRVDPEMNQVVAEIRLPAGCSALVFGEGALWAACPSEDEGSSGGPIGNRPQAASLPHKDRVLRINPQTNLVEKRIDVSGRPRALAVGENSIWVLCETDGKVDRIDPKTNKVTKSIELGVPGAEGRIAVGQGSVWVTVEGFPLTRIDPQTEKVVQQFWGVGGGAIQFGANAIWLSNLHEGTLWRLDPKRIQATLAE